MINDKLLFTIILNLIVMLAYFIGYFFGQRNANLNKTFGKFGEGENK